MSDKINIITSGCSFTEIPHGNVINYSNDVGIINGLYEYDKHINYIYFLLDELKKYHHNNYTLYNLAQGSSGNNVIKTRLQNFLQNNKFENSIYLTTQLSGILREISDQSRYIDINHQREEWIFDYDESLFVNYEDIIKKQIDLYTQIDELCDNPNINNKTFFGWGVLSPSDFTDDAIKKNFNNLKIDTYITNKHGNYCTFSPETTKYAGMTEFLLEQNLPISIYVNEFCRVGIVTRKICI